MLDKICRIEYTVAKNKGAQIPEKWSLAPVFIISAKCEINIWQVKIGYYQNYWKKCQFLT